MRNILRSRAALLLTIVFAVQAGVFYGMSRGEAVPVYRPFIDFPTRLGQWQMQQEGVIEPEIKQVLRADDYITRTYSESPTRWANLFVAFFKSQRAGQAPHSPKNCLPGSGWIWTISDTIPITVPGRQDPISVNRYVVQNADQKGLVVYWYQSRDRVVASEYAAKVFVVADALRYNRTDTALVKVWVPIVEGNAQTATDTAVDFVRAFYATLRTYLPS